MSSRAPGKGSGLETAMARMELSVYSTESVMIKRGTNDGSASLFRRFTDFAPTRARGGVASGGPPSGTSGKFAASLVDSTTGECRARAGCDRTDGDEREAPVPSALNGKSCKRQVPLWD